MKIHHVVAIVAAFAISFATAAVEELTVEESDAFSLSSCSKQERHDHPALCRMVDLSRVKPGVVARILQEWAQDHGLLVDIKPPTAPDADSLMYSLSSSIARRQSITAPKDTQQQLPVVLAHGMGDSCFNDGMQRITQRVSQLLGGVYATCIGTGKTQEEDTMNGYFLNMNDSVDVFAQAIQSDEKLKDGFHAMGFSQGNNVIRGYISKVNQPPVHTFISVNGVNAGIGAVPYCRPKLDRDQNYVQIPGGFVSIPSMCNLLMEQASRAAYTEYAQQHSFQANYWRDPRPVGLDRYKRLGQLAAWNNEGSNGVNQTIRDNWAKTSQFVWVMANQDRMVWPKEGEHWGAPDSTSEDPFQNILPMNETEWYQQDLFGLKTAQEAGKNVFESFDGDHLQFTREDFERWVTTYFKN